MDYEALAMKILKKKGFTNIRKKANNYFEAENAGQAFTVGVVGTFSELFGSLSVKWHQLIDWSNERRLGKTPLILFINYKGEYCTFQMADSVL
ncbi:MAG: hypothetical protein ACE5KO_03255 [Candidatus Bathyarchaeia archaeon]